MPTCSFRRISIAAAIALTGSALVPLLHHPAAAAGIERAVPTVRPLFRQGNWAEFGVTHVRPRLRGDGAVVPPVLGLPPGPQEGRTSDILDSYTIYNFMLKQDLTDRASYAIMIDQPWGARTTYGADDFVGGFTYEGTIARIDSRAISTILAYDVMPNVKVYGGLRGQRTEARAAVPFVFGYEVETDEDWTLGWMAGAGFQIPEIALAVSLTYYSRTRHRFDTVESSAFFPGEQEGRLVVDLPQAVNLEFQSGVAADTLVFGSVRWVEWSDFVIEPENYPLGVLVDYPDDWWTFTLGVGRRFNETWSGALQASWEPAVGGTQTTLGPIDGRTTIGAGLTYALGPAEITGTVGYGWLGGAENVLQTQFDDGRFTAFGLRIGTRF